MVALGGALRVWKRWRVIKPKEAARFERERATCLGATPAHG
jgi:hypothetical protein